MLVFVIEVEDGEIIVDMGFGCNWSYGSEWDV